MSHPNFTTCISQHDYTWEAVVAPNHIYIYTTYRAFNIRFEFVVKGKAEKFNLPVVGNHPSRLLMTNPQHTRATAPISHWMAQLKHQRRSDNMHVAYPLGVLWSHRKKPHLTALCVYSLTIYRPDTQFASNLQSAANNANTLQTTISHDDRRNSF